MLTTVEVFINICVILLVPVVVHSLIRGSPPPAMGWLSKFYHAEKHLNLCGNLFLLALCATALGKLGLHFGYIHPGQSDRVAWVTGAPFLVLLVAYLGLWIKAARKVRRLGKNEG